jgi:hypothetical protein
MVTLEALSLVPCLAAMPATIAAVSMDAPTGPAGATAFLVTCTVPEAGRQGFLPE